MKTLNYLFLTIGALAITDVFASTAVLEHSATPTGIYTTNPILTCTRNLRIRYDYGYDPSNSWGLNPYKITATLYRNGAVIKNYTNGNGLHAWSIFSDYDMNISQGTYQATVKFEKRTALNGWQTVETKSTNTLTANVSANPYFNINGNPMLFATNSAGYVVANYSNPIPVCKSFIIVNAAATSCESKYFLSVQESDRWWNRTYQYEWETWFSGQAPNGINLQQKSIQYSTSGTELIGGLLPNGQERFYRVSVCTGEPTWNCKSALIKVDNSC